MHPLLAAALLITGATYGALITCALFWAAAVRELTAASEKHLTKITKEK